MNGSITITKTKKGFVAGISGTPLQLTEFTLLESDAGKECEYEVISGRVAKLSIAGQDRSKKTAQQPHATTTRLGGGYNNQRPQQGRTQSNAHHAQSNHPIPNNYNGAPYNFIPLNESAVNFASPPDMASYHNKRNTGHIDLRIETLTPLYIRGTSLDPNQKCSANPEFFSPGNSLKIPGSSLRGMVRELVEIAGFGKFQCDDRLLFFRNIGDSFYRDTMIDMSNNCFPCAKAGILVKRGGRYYIRPSAALLGTEHYRINGQFNGNAFFISGVNGALPQFTFRRIFFQPVAPSNHLHTDPQGRTLQLRYALVAAVSTTPQQGFAEGYLIVSGKFGIKKHMQWIINLPGAGGELEIPDSVIQRYAEDVTRVDDADLTEMLKSHNEVPCFYLTDANGHINAFGHTGLFRHPYQYSVHQHLDSELRAAETIDCAESIFGKLEHWSGRVFFEDASLEPGQQNVLMESTSPKILSGPKPTTFQHYLVSANGRPQHWGVKTAKLRGYKLYWHRNTQQQDEHDWKEEEIKTDSQHTIIRPVHPHKTFKGRIRFENLSDVELGALLFVINLPGTCRHKLGMGKPLGLGSVEISSQLALSDRESRYRELFCDIGWSLPQKQKRSDEIILSFENFVLSGMSASDKDGAQRLWDTQRMKMLKTMLDWNNTQKAGWNGKTRYMEIERGKTATKRGTNEYKGRPVLPDPLIVVT
jgi:CRISPR-associated protein (TIGR03986 family)